MPVIVSQKHQRLVVPPVPGVEILFPDAPKLPDGNFVIPHGLREMKMLQHLGFAQVPNPLLMYYDWGGGHPFAVQRATVKMLTENPRAYVCNAMGTGKTKAALWAWDAMRKAGLAKKALVLAPLSTLRFVWQREAFCTIPGIKTLVLHGSKQVRLEKLAEDADMYIINHDGLKVIQSELHSRADIDTLIIDELAVYRNNSDRSKRMRKFAKRFSIVWGMTGTPMPNEPTDVWAQCKIITPNSVPDSFYRCREMLMVRSSHSDYVWFPKADAIDNAFKMMQPSVRYTLDDVVELPPAISRSIDVELSAEQRAAYDNVAKHCQALIAEKVITAQNAGVVMGKLLQIAGGWVYTQAPEFVRINPAPRIEALVDLIEAADHKVIVFVPYRHAIEEISKLFLTPALSIEHLVVHGETKDRDDAFNKFQNTDRWKVLLAHPGCVHHGLTLTAADTIIWYLPVMSLDIYDQANARITRVGQQHKQQILHLQATPIERKVYRMLKDHQKTQNQFLKMVEEASGEADCATLQLV